MPAKSKLPPPARKLILFDAELETLVNDYAKRNKIGSFNGAVRALIKNGLSYSEVVSVKRVTANEFTVDFGAQMAAPVTDLSKTTQQIGPDIDIRDYRFAQHGGTQEPPSPKRLSVSLPLGPTAQPLGSRLKATPLKPRGRG